MILMMECHANLECCISIKATKYIHKYIYKGHDRTTMAFGSDQDEIKQYLDARYISASESSWRLFRYNMHEESPNVVRLAVHLPNEQPVIFNANEQPVMVLNRAGAKDTTLTAFFKKNAEEEEEDNANPIIGPRQHFSRGLLYQEFPQKYTWNLVKHIWKERQRGFAIGRMYFAHPSSGERFYLRTLLTVIRGPTSFRNLRTFNGVEAPTFKEACLARGLLEDDNEWSQCLQEAAVMQTGGQLRHLFTTILHDCNPTAPLVLWNQFKEHICDDLKRKLQHMGHENPTEEQVYDYGLYLIDLDLRKKGKSLEQCPPMPLPVGNWAQLHGNRLIAEQLAYDQADQRDKAQQRLGQLNEEQHAAYDAIINAIENNTPKMFFLNGPAGTGKTFLYNTICYHLRGNGMIVLCVASSGIAALLLIGGRTAHSTFRIPIQLHDGKSCSIKKGTHLADLIKIVSAIIWDEVPMQDRLCQEAVDMSFRDNTLHSPTSPGGLLVHS